MTASLLTKVRIQKQPGKVPDGFCGYDEVFSVAMVDGGNVNVRFMAGLQSTSGRDGFWAPWPDFSAGTFLSPALSAAMQVAHFACSRLFWFLKSRNTRLVAFLTALLRRPSQHLFLLCLDVFGGLVPWPFATDPGFTGGDDLFVAARMP
jgi:hypothetical protein